jgi:hypothetical protein
MQDMQSLLDYPSLYGISHTNAMAIAQHMHKYKNYRLLHTRVPENVSRIEKLHIDLYFKYRDREGSSKSYYRYAPALYHLIRMKKYVIFVRTWCTDLYMFDKYTMSQVHTHNAFEVHACARMLNGLCDQIDFMVFCVDET